MEGLPRDILKRKSVAMDGKPSALYIPARGLRHSSSLPNINLSPASPAASSAKPSDSPCHIHSPNPVLPALPILTECHSELDSLATKLNALNIQNSTTNQRPESLSKGSSRDYSDFDYSSMMGLGKRTSSSEILASLPINLIQQWILAFAVVNFDLELGPTLDCIFPDIELSKEEKTTICFASFPDSNLSVYGDSIFSFRLRTNAGNALLAPTEYNHAGNFTYGYVYFRQMRDKKNRRGYFQKSVVILTLCPYHGLYSKLVGTIGPMYFDCGKPTFEAACKDISTWNPPQPGHVYEVPFLNKLITIDVPRLDAPIFLETSIFKSCRTLDPTQIMAPLLENALYTSCKPTLKELWTLWELLVTGESIVVFSSNPVLCSSAIHALVDLISPIPFGGDFRPYLTIQDADFKAFTSKSVIPPGTVLGVTNPFFISSLQHWHHFLRLDDPSCCSTANHNTSMMSSFLGRKSSMDLPVGLRTKYQNYVSHDRSILQRLDELALTTSNFTTTIATNQLRKQFHDVTEKFLVPLNRYFMTLIPSTVEYFKSASTGNPNKIKLLPKFQNFNHEDFLKSLYENGPTLKFKMKHSMDWIDLYKKFLKSVHFPAWLQKKTQIVKSGIHRQFLEAACRRNSGSQSDEVKSPKMESFEIVNVILFLKSQLESKDLMLDPESKKYKALLQSRISYLVSKLPESLKTNVEMFINE